MIPGRRAEMAERADAHIGSAGMAVRAASEQVI
jgi:hypothetical protein